MAITWENLAGVGGGEDRYLMATFHHYNPIEFHSRNQGDFTDQLADDHMSEPMKVMSDWANETGNGMPVNIGEWGAAWGFRYQQFDCNNVFLLTTNIVSPPISW